TTTAERSKGNDAKVDGPADWQYLYDNIIKGNALHDSLRDLAAKLIASGTSAGAAVNQLRALMEASSAPHDERWQERFDDIPRRAGGGVKKFSKGEDKPEGAGREDRGKDGGGGDPPLNPAPDGAPQLLPISIDEAIKVFQHWLLMEDSPPVYAVLGTVAANRL